MKIPCFCKEGKKCHYCRLIEKDLRWRLFNSELAKEEPDLKRVVAPINCKYRGETLRTKGCSTCNNKTKIKVFKCEQFKECTILQKFDDIQGCATCTEFTCVNCDFDEVGVCKVCRRSIDLNDAAVITRECRIQEKSERKQSNVPIIYRNGNPLQIKDLYKNKSVFFIGTGPSLVNQQKILDKLQSERGLITFAVNNIAARNIRPNLWTHVDVPKSFHKAIWEDPAILKLTPMNRSKNHYRNGVSPVRQCPNTLEYRLRTPTHFNANNFLTEDSVSWGCEKGIKCDGGMPGGRSVMFAAIKLMYYLGFRNIYLLGCDFNMQHDPNGDGKGLTYAFHQYKHAGGCKTNNSCYKIMDERFKAIQPKLLENNCHIYNCTEKSRLTAFPSKGIEEAIEEALENFPKDIQTRGMYG